MERDSFVFYASFLEAINELPNESQLKVYKAITNFALKGIEPTDLEGIEKGIFALIKPQILANYKRYLDGCNGGRPKKEKPMAIEKENHRLLNKKTNGYENKKPNDNVNDNDNVNVNVNDNVNVNTNRVPKAQFRKPTKQEITDFAIENKLKLDAIDDFIDYYEGNGWKIGRNPMKDWKATFRRWCRSQFRVAKTDQIEEILQAGRE